MRQRLIAIALLLCALFITATACSRGSLATVDSIPDNAKLLFTHESGYENGIGVTHDSFANQDETGYFVVDIVLKGGEIKKLKINELEAGEVAAFGDAQNNVTFISDLVTEAAGDYYLSYGQLKDFDGKIDVYFVPGIGYSTGE